MNNNFSPSIISRGSPQLVTKDYQLNIKESKAFNIIDNYIYLYHTKTLIAIPTYPEELSDTLGITFSPTTPLASSAPIYSYSNSGPRTLNISLNLHRDMMKQINNNISRLNVPMLNNEDEYIDYAIKQLQTCALPRYSASEKMVNPPIVAVRFGNEIYCKGVIQGSVDVRYSGPILTGDKYALIGINFTMNEIDPYDADTVGLVGSFRGLNKDLERNIWKKG